MQERQDSHGTIEDSDLEQDSGDLKKALETVRGLVDEAADKPEFFWGTQRTAILNRCKPERDSQRSFLWVPVMVALLLCLLFFGKPGKAPAPDLAAGVDQDLLVDIERILSREYPEAFVPVSFLDYPKKDNAYEIPASGK